MLLAIKTTFNAVEIAQTSAQTNIASNARAHECIVFGRGPLQKGVKRLASAVVASEENFGVSQVFQVEKTPKKSPKLNKRRFDFRKRPPQCFTSEKTRGGAVASPKTS